MQYMVIFTPKPELKVEGMPADFPPLLIKEAARAKDLYAEGMLRQSWVLGTEDKGAACLFEVDSPQHLQEIIESFPLIRANYSDFQIVPLAPDPAFAKRS